MKTIMLLPALAAALFAAPALANDDAASRGVSISAADLSTPAGVARIHSLIEATALDVCQEENRGGVAYRESVRICTEDTVARTVAELDAPLLTAHHDGLVARIQLASTAH